MGRNKSCNPVEEWRKKQKKTQVQKNKKKRAEAREQALKRRPSTWIQTEIRKINRQEQQGQSCEKLTNRKRKLIVAYDKAVEKELQNQQIEDAKQKAEQATLKANIDPDDDSLNQVDDIYADALAGTRKEDEMENIAKHIDNDEEEDQNKPSNINDLLEFPPGLPRPVHLARPPGIINRGLDSNRNDFVSIHPIVHLLDECYFKDHPDVFRKSLYPPAPAQPLVHIIPVITKPQPQLTHYHKRRKLNDATYYDPMNPANPEYNFIREKNYSSVQTNIPRQVKPNEKHQGVDNEFSYLLNKKKKKEKLEVIIDDKMKSLIPSSLLIKRKRMQPVKKAPPKIRNIAPDVGDELDTSKSEENVQANSISIAPITADDAYDEFMRDVKGLL